jgi:GH15 family glucan-1,4-alpha-glucosidase
MIAALGGILSGDATILAAVRTSVALLREHQAPNGCIPNNVDAQTQRPNFRAYADGGLWWIIGSSLVEPDPRTSLRILRWYECQDVDQTGLLSMQESTDWQDLFCTRGKGLYLNALYVLALRASARVFEQSGDLRSAGECRQRADFVRQQINRYFWYGGDQNMLRHVAHTFSTDSPEAQDSLGRKRWLPQKHFLVRDKYYLPYLAFRTPGEWFDSLGHLMAILADVPDASQCSEILSFIETHALAVKPIKSIFPVVHRSDPDWRDYYGMLNTPHHYHNGGVWPFIGGFYVAALVKLGEIQKAEAAMQGLSDLNTCGEFNEWHHGETGEPQGVRHQAWSSGMYLYALECVAQRRVLLLP